MSLIRMLAESGRYVFHGSSLKLKQLEPRQAYKRNHDTGRMEKDGLPVVFATNVPDIAIFMAIVDKSRINGEFNTYFDCTNGNGCINVRLSATPNVLTLLPELSGFVYVLETSDFKKRHGKIAEYISQKPVYPVAVVPVTAEDLVRTIEEYNPR